MEMEGVAVMSLAKRLSGSGGLGGRAAWWHGAQSGVEVPLSIPPLCNVLRMMGYHFLHLLHRKGQVVSGCSGEPMVR